MGKVQCPYCKNISYVPSKSEGQERPCVACGRLFVRIAFAETTQQQEAQDIKAYHESTAYPKPRETVPALIIDKGEANGNVESISKQQLSRSTQRAEQSSAPKSYRVDVSDYSGFWRRVAAHLIDGIVLLPMAFLLPALGKGLILEGFLALLATGTFVPLLLSYLLNLVIILLMLVIYWLYFAKMHSSNKQATFGKMVMGVIVTDTNGNRMSFARATGRNFAKMLLCFGFVMAAFTERRQALHDKIAGTLVVKSDMNNSFKYKRTFVKLVLIYLGIFLFSMACSYLTYHAKARKIDKLKVERLEVPLMPPGFESLVEIGEFDIWDVTDTAQNRIPTAQLSANWSADKEYNKSWQQFTKEEKSEFDALVEKLVVKLRRGVEANGGVFEVERPTEGLYAGSVIGRWEIRHDDKYAHGIFKAPHRWRVRFNAHKAALETPSINVFISQFIIAGEK